jgi:hypothetical protein
MKFDQLIQLVNEDNSSPPCYIAWPWYRYNSINLLRSSDRFEKFVEDVSATNDIQYVSSKLAYHEESERIGPRVFGENLIEVIELAYKKYGHLPLITRYLSKEDVIAVHNALAEFRRREMQNMGYEDPDNNTDIL